MTGTGHQEPRIPNVKQGCGWGGGAGPTLGAPVSNRERLGGGEAGNLSRDAAGGSREKRNLFS